MSRWFTEGNKPLEEADPEIFDIIEKEKRRQYVGLEMIASENYTSRAVMEANGCCMTNKYSEGQIGARYYGGNQHIDEMEALCKKRALEAFHLDGEKWGVNVQPYSGSGANFAVYTALLRPHDRIMGLDLPSGGHLTHGYYTATKKISASSVYFESLPYKVNQETGWLDYDGMESLALAFKPKLLIAGGSAYTRQWDIERMRKIADMVGAYLMFDIAHISGLVATGNQNNPFTLCDIVTSTTHKTLRGPRKGIIFYKKDERGFEAKINEAVFPGLQGGPHNHTMAALATALLQASKPEFTEYATQVITNAQALSESLKKRGYTMVTGGTDNHIVLWDLRSAGITGSKAELVFEAAEMSVNKNSVPGQGNNSMLSPAGVRLGTSTLTSRGLDEKDFDKVADFLHRGVQIAQEIQSAVGKKLADFRPAVHENADVAKLRDEVIAFSKTFFMPGFDVETMKYKE